MPTLAPTPAPPPARTLAPTLAPVPAPAPEPVDAPVPEASCLIWGDPHARVFDSAKAGAPNQSVLDIFSHGDFWVVKSAAVSIQGRYGATVWATSGLSATRALAVGGPFLEGHKLVVEPKDGQILWDGEAILGEMPSEWAVPGLAKARLYSAERALDPALTYKSVATADIELPSNVRLIVNRWRQHLDVLITMPPQAGGQDGHCGNYNGNATDDAVDMLKERMHVRVVRSESLFPTDFYSLRGCFGDDPGNRDGRDLPVFQGKGLSLRECAFACRDFEYFGLQAKRECYCGRSYGKYGQLLNKDCKCQAADIGAGRNCVYEFGGATEPTKQGLADCDPVTRAAAERRCQETIGPEGGQTRDACVLDACFGGFGFA